jgi:hypothetical protein
MKTWALLLIVATLPTAVVAGDRDYQCLVKQSFTLDADGTLNPQDPTSLLIGEQFAVDRSTGRIVGGFLDNGRAKEIRVIDTGGANTSAFQSISINSSGRTEYLFVREYATEPLKAFISVSLTLVRVGVCR